MIEDITYKLSKMEWIMDNRGQVDRMMLSGLGVDI